MGPSTRAATGMRLGIVSDDGWVGLGPVCVGDLEPVTGLVQQLGGAYCSIHTWQLSLTYDGGWVFSVGHGGS